ncbi:MAG: MurT ligase domain-containing protein [Syntrophomonas sp.]|nr:MurT ligase domain-containing protein [Syntrophomonas sp.]
MLNLRKIAAILAGKLIAALSRMAGNQGTNLPGKIALEIYPQLLHELGQNIEKDIFLVTGTNGKTTTANMIAEIFKASGNTYVHNQAGANMLPGITTALLEHTDITGQKKLDYAVLETDEANVPLVIAEIKPRMILITNFFRDQLDRYGELDSTINLIKKSVSNTEIELLLNADDPLQLTFQASSSTKYWHYGLDVTNYDSFNGSESREGRYCILCGQELEYTRYHYSQLGKYHCPQCDIINPAPDFLATDLHLENGIDMQIDSMSITSPFQGLHNAYNILAAVSLAKLAGIEEEFIQSAIANYQPTAGRMEKFKILGKKVVLVLVKNPTGLNQSLATLVQDPAVKNLFIALNDNAADGRDISWIWDADVEVISSDQAHINQIICSGKRSGDMAVRIKYSGFEPAPIVVKPSLEEGIESAIRRESEACYILCTYTALFASRKILLRMQKKYPELEPERKKAPGKML